MERLVKPSMQLEGKKGQKGKVSNGKSLKTEQGAQLTKEVNGSSYKKIPNKA